MNPNTQENKPFAVIPCSLTFDLLDDEIQDFIFNKLEENNLGFCRADLVVDEEYVFHSQNMEGEEGMFLVTIMTPLKHPEMDKYIAIPFRQTSETLLQLSQVLLPSIIKKSELNANKK